MSTSVITTMTGLISDAGRTLPVVELQRHRIRVATRLSPCRDSVVCITATQSRPNNFQLRTELLRCQDRREIHARILAVEPLPLASGDAHSGRRPPERRGRRGDLVAQDDTQGNRASRPSGYTNE